MEIKGVGIGRGVAVGSVIRMAAPLPELPTRPVPIPCRRRKRSTASLSRWPW